MIQLLWIHKKNSERQKEEILNISDAPKIDYFWVLTETQIPEPLGDTDGNMIHIIL